ncbi:MAG: hypothetical protein J0L92_34165 [Deltaproteobacteria bacterium]|nr:hypothetical protein [Deltaproteobacteria bacterium]
MSSPLARASLVLVVALVSIGCAGQLPTPLYANELDAHFPESGQPTGGGEGGSAAVPRDDATSAAIHAEAVRCADRLNDHRGTAEIVSILQAILSTVGGVTSTVGGIFAAVDLGDPDLRTAMGAMSSAGAGVVLVGNLVLGLLANPLEELRRASDGRRSWDLAIELQYAGAPPDAVRASLTRCVEDQGPPVRVVGAGLAVSF